MKVEEITPGTPVIYFQKISLAGFKSDPIQTEITSVPWCTSEKHFCKIKGFDNYVNIEHLDKAIEPSHEAKELRSMINRLKGHIEQIKAWDIFTDYDRKILLPRYESNLLVLQKKLAINEKQDEQRAREIEVRGAIEVTGRS